MLAHLCRRHRLARSSSHELQWIASSAELGQRSRMELAVDHETADHLALRQLAICDWHRAIPQFRQRHQTGEKGGGVDFADLEAEDVTEVPERSAFAEELGLGVYRSKTSSIAIWGMGTPR